MPFAREIDPDDQQGNGYAYYDGRLVNPPFVFGAGGVELLAKEMTIDLQLLKLKALSKPGYEIPLVTKGVSFGTISWEQRTGYDTSHVVGVDPDLVVRPFGRKGDNATVRQFDLNALPFHMGMQPVETVGQGVDDDGDGVRDEVLVGEVSAMDLFQVCSDAPHQAPLATKSERNGRYLFDELGCARCHVPSMTTRTRFLPLAFPEVPTDPTFGIYYAIDLSRVPGFAHAGAGVQVPLYSDLKRHDLGPLMGEATGSPLDRMFITPRLWGVADTAPYMHDGRALSLTQAILMHGGEAQGSTQLFAGLKSWQQEDLLAFLRTLHTPANPNADL